MKKIFGHRALPNSYPENTFLSLNKALEICDFVETDVRITKDKELILFHDPTLNNQKIEELMQNGGMYWIKDDEGEIGINAKQIHSIEFVEDSDKREAGLV